MKKVLDVRINEDGAFYFYGMEIEALVMPVESIWGVVCELDVVSFY